MKVKYKLKRKLTKIHDFFRYDIHQGIKNLIRWFPVIWKDRDFDHWFIYEVLRKKLKLTEDFQEDHGICVSHKQIAKQIRICRILLDRLSKDDYLENALFWHEKKYGDMSLNFRPYGKTDEWQEMYTKWDDCPPGEEAKADASWKRASKHSDNMQLQDLDMLFQKMRKQIIGWWD